jgi:hypothetical protein
MKFLQEDIVMTENDMVVNKYKIERVCTSGIDPDQLVLQPVDNSESVYSRTLVELNDASLPDSILKSVEQDGPPLVVSWDLFLMLKYRQDWKPSAYGLGELINTMSLLPNEELTIEVKTWETSKTQQDEEQKLDEQNVSDIKMTSSSIDEATTEDKIKTHEYVDAKAGYSGFGASVSVAAGYSQDVSNFQKEFAKQTREQSEQTTNKYRATRKVRMAISRESGSESKTTRKIRNINQAYTLNVNFFGILREYEISLHLYDVSMVLLGAEVSLRAHTRYIAIDGSGGQALNLGEVINLSSSAANVQALMQQEGISPIKVIRAKWGTPLYDAAIPAADWTKTQLKHEQRVEFQKKVLECVRPAPGWMAPDSTGTYRWAYEIIPGTEEELLVYLYGFVPFSFSHIVGTALLADMQPRIAYVAASDQYVAATMPSYQDAINCAFGRQDISRQFERSADLIVGETDVILAPGHFAEMKTREFIEVIPEWVGNILDSFKQVAQTKGKVDDWKAVLPTDGIHADLSLGICSGAEDYYEVQRQFDLDLKKLEVEKLKLEVEKLKIVNKSLEKDKPDVLIKNPTEKTSVNLNISASDSPIEVDIESKKE